jgi:ABC-type nitrate/sulfonate/bicarbonate transport system permease component
MNVRRVSVTAIRGIAVIVAALAVWQVLYETSVLDHSAFPSATSAVDSLWQALGTSDFWSTTGVTLRSWIEGLAIGCAIGMTVGVAIGLSNVAYRSLALLVEFLKTVPVVAALPLAILIFGTTPKMNVFLVALGITWPIMIQAAYGVRSIEPVVRDTATVFRMSRTDRLLHLVIPSAAPYIATGLRLASTGALLLVVVAQLIGGGGGLGYEIFVAQNSSLLPRMYALVIVVGLLGVIITFVFTALEKRALHWHESQRSVVI